MRGYDVLTPVQESVLAPELRDADVLVSAQTGSGKTVAFGIAVAPNLLEGAEHLQRVDSPLALVVAPTRELAMQVKLELAWLFEMTGASVASCVGGMDMRDERRVLQRGAHIVVGTPGRLRDHIERGSLDMTGLRAVVLDEADEMLDLGFREDLEYILDAAPSERRTLMFSATVPHSITGLARRYQRDAVRISTNADQKQHVDIEYRALTVAPNDRENAIVNVLRHMEAKNAMVFCSTRAMVNHMTSRFINRGFSVVALSGELSQTQRSHALQALRDGRARVCIATDVAARGIDLPNLELVIHADLPKNREGLLHRSGRTGRAGRKGTCVLIVPHNARIRTERLLKSANVIAEWARPPSIYDIMQRDRERILDDPALSEPPTGDELAFVADLLGKHGAEQIATAFLRLYRTGRSAPEELLDTASPEPQKKRRDDFKNGVWFSLSVGYKHNAEPRWLVPMLCRAGHLTKGDIGAIKIRPDESHVELHPDCVKNFLAAIGPSRMVEDSIALKKLTGPPAAQNEATGNSGGKAQKPYEGKKPYEGRKRHESNKPYEGKKPYEGNNSYEKKMPHQARMPDASSGPLEEAAIPKRKFARDAGRNKGDAVVRGNDRPFKGKKDKTGKKPVGKKGRKPLSARKPLNLAAPDRAPNTAGFAPRKRKKPSKKPTR